jgi:hypothetical protein
MKARSASVPPALRHASLALFSAENSANASVEPVPDARKDSVSASAAPLTSTPNATAASFDFCKIEFIAKVPFALMEARLYVRRFSGSIAHVAPMLETLRQANAAWVFPLRRGVDVPRAFQSGERREDRRCGAGSCLKGSGDKIGK